MQYGLSGMVNSAYLVDPPISNMGQFPRAFVQRDTFHWNSRNPGSKSQNGPELHSAVIEVKRLTMVR